MRVVWSKLRSARKWVCRGESSSPTWRFLNQTYVLAGSVGTGFSGLVEKIFPRLRQRSTDCPNSYLEMEGRICAAGVATSLGGFGL